MQKILPKIFNSENVAKVAKITSKLQNSKLTLPTVIVESAVIAGRSYYGFKRGGKDEFRERIFEETTTAGIWLFGVRALNKVGNFIGKNFLNLDKLDYDVGKDALRNPSLGIPKGTAIFKFSKIALSVLATTSFMGFVLPRIKQKMTKNVKNKEWVNYNKVVHQPMLLENYINGAKAHAQAVGVTENNKTNAGFKGNFKGGATDWLLRASHNLENHNVWRLISTDAGIITGRVASSRNKYEAREYLFRDVASMYFYLAALPNALSLLNKATKTPKINPMAALETQQYLIEKVGDAKFGVEEFGRFLLDKTLRDGMDKIPFENDVVKLDVLKNILDEKSFNKADLMSQLQPKIGSDSVLSRLQVQDALSDSWLSDPQYLKRVTLAATDKLSGDKSKFVSKKEIDGIRKSVDDLAQSLVDFARKKGVEQIDADFVEKFIRRNIFTTAGFTVAGLAFACFGLAFLVPKLQQLITYKATGESGFPGAHNFAHNKEAK